MAGFVEMGITQEEYDKRIRDKAIDEFSLALKLKYPYFVEDVGFVEANKMLHKAIEEIAEQMKNNDLAD